MGSFEIDQYKVQRRIHSTVRGLIHVAILQTNALRDSIGCSQLQMNIWSHASSSDLVFQLPFTHLIPPSLTYSSLSIGCYQRVLQVRNAAHTSDTTTTSTKSIYSFRGRDLFQPTATTAHSTNLVDPGQNLSVKLRSPDKKPVEYKSPNKVEVGKHPVNFFFRDPIPRSDTPRFTPSSQASSTTNKHDHLENVLPQDRHLPLPLSPPQHGLLPALSPHHPGQRLRLQGQAQARRRRRRGLYQLPRLNHLPRSRHPHGPQIASARVLLPQNRQAALLAQASATRAPRRRPLGPAPRENSLVPLCWLHRHTCRCRVGRPFSRV